MKAQDRVYGISNLSKALSDARRNETLEDLDIINEMNVILQEQIKEIQPITIEYSVDVPLLQEKEKLDILVIELFLFSQSGFRKNVISESFLLPFDRIVENMSMIENNIQKLRGYLSNTSKESENIKQVLGYFEDLLFSLRQINICLEKIKGSVVYN